MVTALTFAVAIIATIIGWRDIDAAPPASPLSIAGIAMTAAVDVPLTGWSSDPALASRINAEARRRHLDPPSAWVRYHFDRAADGDRLSLSTEFMRERFTIYLNGVDIYRTNGNADDRNLAWHHPLFLPLPQTLLRKGSNTLMFRLQSVPERPLAIGKVVVGPDVLLRRSTNRQIMFETTAPQVINGVLAILTLGTLLFWLVRPQEQVFGWLALVGALWWFRNLHYFIASPPFREVLFWHMTTDSIFVLQAAVYGFAATFLDIPNRKKIILIVAGGSALAIGIRHLLVLAGRPDFASFLLTIPVTFAVLYALAVACLRLPRIENLLMLAAVAIATAFGFHDLMMSVNSPYTAGVYLQPFGSLLVFSAFGFALGRRMLLALAVNENVNAVLERRVAAAMAELERSEAIRRELQVANAVESERERMMREIHDGIGSSLITALAVAERLQESPGTISTLKRSITDLRIGVDSLEPIDGDVVMLLASLRHRMERELTAAGLTFVWKVENVPGLAWLDAVAALHVLRILQEAIGNILAHAGAATIEVSCSRVHWHDRDGVQITIADNGHGFDPDRIDGGRGLSNMHARAEALNATFTCKSSPVDGTAISLWLPRYIK